MKILLVSFVSFFYLANCSQNQKHATISILNHTQYVIDSIRINTYQLDTTVGGVLPSKKIEPRVRIIYKDHYEGVFRITVYPRGFKKKHETRQFGYYANSSDIKSRYNIELYDTFLLKERNY